MTAPFRLPVILALALLGFGCGGCGTEPQHDTAKPTVTLTAPLANSTLTGLVRLAATASDNVAVAKVWFTFAGSYIAEDASPPFSLNWNSVLGVNSTGPLCAKAFDTSNNESDPSCVSVTIFNLGMPSGQLRVTVAPTLVLRGDSVRVGAKLYNLTEQATPDSIWLWYGTFTRVVFSDTLDLTFVPDSSVLTVGHVSAYFHNVTGSGVASADLAFIVTYLPCGQVRATVAPSTVNRGDV